MDPVTHTLAGITLSGLAPRRNVYFWVLVVSSLLPDIDYVTRLWGIESFLRYHRGITHGILAMFFFTLLVAGVFRVIYGAGFISYLIVSFAGYAVHLFLDLTNQYGTRILSPFDWDQYSLGLTFIIDPYISLTFIAAVVLMRFMRPRRFVISMTAAILIFGYVGSKAIFKNSADNFLRQQVNSRHIYLAPLPNDFLRWWYVISEQDNIRTGMVDLFTQRTYEHDDLVYSDLDPMIMLSKDNRHVESFLNFARFPFPSVFSKDGYTLVEWRELSYGYIPGRHFIASVIYDAHGNEISSSFDF